MSQAEPPKARDLKAGQRVYVGHLNGWYTLSSDARPHPKSENVTVLEFFEIPKEYRWAHLEMRVRPSRRRIGSSAGREL